MISRNADAAAITAKMKADAQRQYKEVFGEYPPVRWGHIKIADAIQNHYNKK